MSYRNASIITMGLALLAGCGEAPAPTSPPASSAVALPAELFATTAPAGAVALVEAKQGAIPGDRVVFEAQIGGRRAPFLADRAVFFVTDSSLPSCDELPGDTCKYPWDFCCEPADRLRDHMATVRVMADGATPLKRSLEGEHGLAPLKTVVVTGIVRTDDGGNFLVDADAIHVKEG